MIALFEGIFALDNIYISVSGLKTFFLQVLCVKQKSVNFFKICHEFLFYARYVEEKLYSDQMFF